MDRHTTYIRHYAENDCYSTPVNLFHLPIPASLNFYSRMLKILLVSNREARHNLYNDFRWANSSIDVVKALENSGIKLNFYGMHNILKTEKPVVFVGNHMSTLETMVLPSIIQPLKKVIFVIKEELAKYPVFGPIAMARDPILVGRENPREDLKIVLEEGSKKLQVGTSIIIFLQKNRSNYLDPASCNSLGIKLAKKNNVPVIPVALITDAWGNGNVIKEVGKIDAAKEVHIAFGEPIEVSGSRGDEYQAVLDFIAWKFRGWGRGELVKSL
jgi:1-acyl-sn-glycerol-3-phosphate acyltransferase